MTVTGGKKKKLKTPLESNEGGFIIWNGEKGFWAEVPVKLEKSLLFIVAGWAGEKVAATIFPW